MLWSFACWRLILNMPAYNKCRGMLCRRLTIACLVLLPAISLNAQNVSKLKATKHVGDSIARSITHPRVADSIPASILGESSTGNAVIKKGQKVQSGLRKGLDSLGGSATSTENVVQDRIRKERNTLDSLERIAKSPLDSLQERVGNLKEKWAGKVDVDSIERVSERLQPLAIPSLDNVRPPLNIPNRDGLDIPPLTVNELHNAPLPEGIPKVDIPDPPSIESSIDKISSQANIIDEHKDILIDPRSLDSARIVHEVENQALKSEPVKAVNQEFEKVSSQQASYQALLQRYRDEKLNREEITRKAKAIVNSQINEHFSPLKPVETQLSMVNNKLSFFKKLKGDLFSVSPELSSRKFGQRLTPGIMWQLNKREFLIVDASVQIGYQLNRRFTAGFGAVYRVGIGDQLTGWIRDLDVFGGRVYVEGNIGKGAFLQGEFEALRVLATSPLIKPGVETAPNRVYGSYFGLGKRINIARRIAFVAQAKYRVGYTNEINKVSKVSARFGLEYLFRRPRRDLTGMKK
jgi:hypothetical protein